MKKIVAFKRIKLVKKYNFTIKYFNTKNKTIHELLQLLLFYVTNRI